MLSAAARAWRRLTWRGRLAWAGAVIGTVLCLMAAVDYMADSDGLTIVDPVRPGATPLMVFLMIALDAVIRSSLERPPSTQRPPRPPKARWRP